MPSPASIRNFFLPYSAKTSSSPAQPSEATVGLEDVDEISAVDETYAQGGEVYDCWCDLEYTELGFQIQCEVCDFWQHGVCAGFSTIAELPDPYACDRCLEQKGVSLTEPSPGDEHKLAARNARPDSKLRRIIHYLLSLSERYRSLRDVFGVELETSVMKWQVQLQQCRSPQEVASCLLLLENLLENHYTWKASRSDWLTMVKSITSDPRKWTDVKELPEYRVGVDTGHRSLAKKETDTSSSSAKVQTPTIAEGTSTINQSRLALLQLGFQYQIILRNTTRVIRLYQKFFNSKPDTGRAPNIMHNAPPTSGKGRSGSGRSGSSSSPGGDDIKKRGRKRKLISYEVLHRRSKLSPTPENDIEDTKCAIQIKSDGDSSSGSSSSSISSISSISGSGSGSSSSSSCSSSSSGSSSRSNDNNNSSGNSNIDASGDSRSNGSKTWDSNSKKKGSGSSIDIEPKSKTSGKSSKSTGGNHSTMDSRIDSACRTPLVPGPTKISHDRSEDGCATNVSVSTPTLASGKSRSLRNSSIQITLLDSFARASDQKPVKTDSETSNLLKLSEICFGVLRRVLSVPDVCDSDNPEFDVSSNVTLKSIELRIRDSAPHLPTLSLPSSPPSLGFRMQTRSSQNKPSGLQSPNPDSPTLSPTRKLPRPSKPAPPYTLFQDFISDLRAVCEFNWMYHYDLVDHSAAHAMWAEVEASVRDLISNSIIVSKTTESGMFSLDENWFADISNRTVLRCTYSFFRKQEQRIPKVIGMRMGRRVLTQYPRKLGTLLKRRLQPSRDSKANTIKAKKRRRMFHKKQDAADESDEEDEESTSEDDEEDSD